MKKKAGKKTEQKFNRKFNVLLHGPWAVKLEFYSSVRSPYRGPVLRFETEKIRAIVPISAKEAQALEEMLHNSFSSVWLRG
jgi:hypothetical protein